MQQYNSDMDRVASLIDSYREAIGGYNSKNRKALQEYIETEEKKSYEVIEKRIANGEAPPRFTHIEWPMEMEYKIKANEQLLGHFYSKVAGLSAEKGVLLQLLSAYYDDTFFSDEEEDFLTTHFEDVVNYIIKTSYLSFQEYSDLKEVHLLPSELLELISTEFVVPEGATIYNPFTGFAQFSRIYRKNKFICEESYTVGRERNCKDDTNWLWAWMKVALYANTINADVFEDNSVPTSYDYAISYVPFTTIDFLTNPNEDTFQNIRKNICDEVIISKLQLAYQNLSSKGKMLLIVPDYLLWKHDNQYPLGALWRNIVNENYLAKIIQLPSTCNGLNYNFCILIIEKERQSNDVVMMDARFATKTPNLRTIELEDYLNETRKNRQKSSESTLPSGYRSVFINGEEKMVEEYDVPFFQTLDLDLYNGMLHNSGKDPNTGLRKMVTINHNDLNLNLLLPQVYVIEKPQNIDGSISLSRLCTHVPTIIRELKYDLPMDTPWVKERNLAYTFQGPLNILEVEKADCPNNPPHTDDYSFNQLGELSEEKPWYQRKPIGRRVLEYRKSTCLKGSKDAVFINYETEGCPYAVLTAQEKPVAIEKRILVFSPNDGVELMTLAAILKMPIVYNQIIAYKRFGLANHLDNIIVPYDKWLIENEVDRLMKEAEMTNRLRKDYENIRKSVRMRKHALTQSLSSIEAMFYALNAYRIRTGGALADGDIISRVKGTTVGDAFEFLSKGIKDMMPALEHIAEVEYTFSEPAWINPETFIELYISVKEKGWLNFKPFVTWNSGNNIAKDNVYEPTTGEPVIRKGEALSQIYFPKDALNKILGNIISNAQSYGFTEESRKDYRLKFSWHMDGTSLIVEIENNGTPIPDERDTASLLEYGVSTDLHHNGHNGIGCNEIDDIMRRYGGKVEIVSSPENEYTVKYILTFYHSNIARTF